MLVYLAAPYSSVQDKAALMKLVMTTAARYMLANPGEHVVSPLYNHYALEHMPDLGSDWQYWQRYSIDLLRRCDKLLLLQVDGWREATGVKAELDLAAELRLPVVVSD